MLRSVARAAALLVVAPFLTFASALASQHVHEPGPGHDHDPAVAHSHFGPHAVNAHRDDGTEIEEDDVDHGHVVWLDSSILHEAPYHAAPAHLAIPVSFEIVQAEPQWSATVFDAAAPPHGPPRTVLRFRGPPPSLV